MVPKTQWTIQDYLKQAGMASDGTRRTPAARLSRNASENDFARILAGSQANAPRSSGSSGGRRIADYLKTPVAAKMPGLGRPVFSNTSDALPSGAPACLPPSMPPALGESQLRQNPGMETSRLESVTPKEPLRPPTQASDPIAQQIDQSIEKAAAAYDLPAELLRGVIRAESNFQVRAVSPAGAQGLMQLMPATARELGVTDPFDIGQNIDGGARYLRRMLDMFDGDVKQALCAYNAGPGTVMKYDGRVPYQETRQYVRKVMLYARR